uniref:U2A'/phosphoprotein 32 family A C-terminal domain-containing protein n=1 Tax=Graphocephala atropunctata TaxID=36148 RepID=A0A1B6KDI3_9HEMI
MAKLTEEMVQARTRQSNLSAVSKLNCWGSELQDVSLIRKLLNVETLSLSVNRIRTLSDFQNCKRLKHLFVRKNEIRDLNQVCYLQDLPALTTLWLAENPCANSPGYRLAVLKALPNLEKLDDVSVTPEERSEAQRIGMFLHHPDHDEQYADSPESEVEPVVSGYAEEDTEEQYVTRSNHYGQSEYSRHYQRNDECSPDSASPAHTSYMRNSANNYHQDEDADDDSPPRYLKQEEDMEDIMPRGNLTRSRTESLPRLSRLEAEEPEDYPRVHNIQRCRLDTLPRSMHHEQEDSDCSQPRSNLTRSRTVDMLGGHHAGSLSSLHERERERSRLKPCELYSSRSLQQHPSRPRNINVLNAVLCLIKELELQDLELVALSVNCRIDELRI